jgi:hypothetical protein
MTYSKPEVVTLGNATATIEQTGVKPFSNLIDGARGQNPGYDLNE